MKNMTTEIKLLEMMGRNNIRHIQELHKKTGISRTVISNLINGNQNSIRLTTIEKLCKALNCDIGDLIVFKK